MTQHTTVKRIFQCAHCFETYGEYHARCPHCGNQEKNEFYTRKNIRLPLEKILLALAQLAWLIGVIGFLLSVWFIDQEFTVRTVQNIFAGCIFMIIGLTISIALSALAEILRKTILIQQRVKVIFDQMS